MNFECINHIIFLDELVSYIFHCIRKIIFSQLH